MTTTARTGPAPSSVAVADWLSAVSSTAARPRLVVRPSTAEALDHELADPRSAVGNSSAV
jgi:hypothetical protein